MFVSIIDCGTTNSRVYILDEKGEIVSQKKRKIGVRDTAITGSSDTLRGGLVSIFHDIFRETEIREKDISYCVTGGMITSEIGLIEIPHLIAPAGIANLASNVQVVADQSVLPLDFPFMFVPGVKNDYPQMGKFESIRFMDFMRGEEIQAVGVLRKYPEISPPFTIIVLSSHTKYIYIDKKERIAGSITTLSGQIYEALKSSTSIGKSIQANSLNASEELIQETIVAAATIVREAGFLRALLMPRFMEVLLDTTPGQRKLFIESAIIAEDLAAFREYQQLFGISGQSVFLVGDYRRCEIFKRMVKILKIDVPDFITVSDETEIDELNIKGALVIAAKVKNGRGVRK
jgi:2-dehydro-3-deoxygalactonokinase